MNHLVEKELLVQQVESNMQEKIENLIKEALKSLNIEANNFSVEHPDDFKNGDYSTNVAMALSKKTGKNPKEFTKRDRKSGSCRSWVY